jgi:hypothetical protein
VRPFSIIRLSFQKFELIDVLIHTISSSSSTWCQQSKALVDASFVPVKF